MYSFTFETIAWRAVPQANLYKNEKAFFRLAKNFEVEDIFDTF